MFDVPTGCLQALGEIAAACTMDMGTVSFTLGSGLMYVLMNCTILSMNPTKPIPYRKEKIIQNQMEQNENIIKIKSQHQSNAVANKGNSNQRPRMYPTDKSKYKEK